LKKSNAYAHLEQHGGSVTTLTIATSMAGKENLSISWKRPKTSPSPTASPPADPVVGCGVDRVVSTKRLKPHELDILGLLNLGMTNQEIANELAVTVSAIKWRVSQIFCKLQVRNRIEAAAHARLQFGLSATGAELPPAGPLPERLREIEIAILRSVNLGMTTQEIASNLNLTVGTVKWRMSQIFGKLQVRNRIQALARARQREWL
jgi:DNA-binding NarL/FixJ family response regulator